MKKNLIIAINIIAIIVTAYIGTFAKLIRYKQSLSGEISVYSSTPFRLIIIPLLALVISTIIIYKDKLQK